MHTLGGWTWFLHLHKHYDPREWAAQPAQEGKETMSDRLQAALWCINQIVSARRIKKPRHQTGIIIAELDAMIELGFILRGNSP